MGKEIDESCVGECSLRMAPYISDLKQRISRLRQLRMTTEGNKNKSKNKQQITPQQGIAVIGSIIIILMSIGGLGLVYNVFAQPR